MTQRERIFSVINSKGWISNADLVDMNLTHAGRNRLTDETARLHFGEKGKYVAFVRGNSWLLNKWELRNLNTGDSNSFSLLKVICHKCGAVFEARKRDVNAGQGRFCSRKCSGAVGGKRRAEKAKPRAVPDGAQLAIL